MIRLISVVGARPNFMKIAPLISAIEVFHEKNGQLFDHTLVHTGQHYDIRMSEIFFKNLGIPEPDINLEVGSGTHAEQVGQTMIAFEQVLKSKPADWVIVVGDVNATLACSVTAKKEHINVCHIEAGLRSGDRTMPEEINRLVTDSISDLLLTPDKLSMENLLREGVSPEKIEFVGNIMIDTLERHRDRAELIPIKRIINENLITGGDARKDRFDLPEKGYAVITLHRPSNVDSHEVLKPLVEFLADEVSADFPVVWPIHPRTRKQMEAFSLWEKVNSNRNMIILQPIGYLEMLRLNMGARILLTDSGGLQEECTILGVPCLTLRMNTERPVTLREYGGASVLVGNEITRIRSSYLQLLSSGCQPFRPELWDGRTAERIIQMLIKHTPSK